MAIFKCKMCGSELQIFPSQSVAECEYCGSKQTLPKIEGNDRKANLTDRANHFFREGEFDKAMDQFEKILLEANDDCDTYWSLVLCRYGVRYVEDPKTKKRLPTVNRVQYTSVFDDENYKAALRYADPEQRKLYEADAATINNIQKGILAISQNEEPFDIFICYKETDDTTKTRTRDSVFADQIYSELVQEDFKVFFAPVTLEDKLGQEYEPYIFAALQSAKVMIVLGTKPEYFQAPWVKNEWSRYLNLIRGGAKKTLIPAYKDMDPYLMPEEFSHLQAQDMSKLGFMQDLIRGIKKLTGGGSAQTTKQDTIVIPTTGAAEIAPLLKRTFLLLEDGEFSHADDLCEEILNKDPENAQAYLAKLMIEFQVKKKAGLSLLSTPFTESPNYKKILRFGDQAIKKELDECNQSIIQRAEERRVRGIYTESVSRLQSATDAETIQNIRASLLTIRAYKDTEAYIHLCDEKLDFLSKAPIYVAACTVLTDSNVWQGKHKDIHSYEQAIEMLRSLNGWRDSQAKIQQCQEHIDQIHLKEEYARMEVIYQEAKHLMNNLGTPPALKKAAEKFDSIKSYMDSAALSKQCLDKVEFIKKNPTYVTACEIFDNSNTFQGAPKNIKAYESAISMFKSLDGFMDSEQRIEQCRAKIVQLKEQEELARQREAALRAERQQRKEHRKEVAGKVSKKSLKAAVIVVPVVALAIFLTILFTVIIPGNKYNAAIALKDEGKYEEAIQAFEALNGFRDSAEQIEICQTAIKDAKYQAACDLMSQGKYEEAIQAFEALAGHKDSQDQIQRCRVAIWDREYATALELMQQGKYDEAIAAFEALNGHKDSENKIKECYAAKDRAYEAAIELIRQGKYDEAIAAFEALKGYKDSAKKIEFANYIKSITLGSSWNLGTYEQDANAANGKETIEWIILDKKGTQLLLISKYALDCQTYNTENDDVTWETSSLRAWLNATFYGNAFSEQDQALIVQSLVSADLHPTHQTPAGNATEDHLFLLSHVEAEKYFTKDADRLCTATPYALSQGAREDCRWWLRTPTYNLRVVSYVSGDGSISRYGDSINNAEAIRPAMWIDLSQLPQYK